MRIDLHTHSTESDGTQAPADVVASAREAGLDVLALTDHDTTRGWAAARGAAQAAGLGFVPGIQQHVELGPDRRDRRAQLMRGVGEKSLLVRQQGGDAVHHVIQCRDQRPCLPVVLARGHRAEVKP